MATRPPSEKFSPLVQTSGYASVGSGTFRLAPGRHFPMSGPWLRHLEPHLRRTEPGLRLQSNEYIGYVGSRCIYQLLWWLTSLQENELEVVVTVCDGGGSHGSCLVVVFVLQAHKPHVWLNFVRDCLQTLRCMIASLWCFQLWDALTYLHDCLSIIHGDLRPQHVLLSSVSKCRIKLCGLGKAFPIGACLKMNSNSGTTQMMRTSQTNLRFLLQGRTSSLRKVPQRHQKSCAYVLCCTLRFR